MLSVAKHKTAFTNELNNRVTLRRKQRAKAENTIERSSMLYIVVQNGCQILSIWLGKQLCQKIEVPCASFSFVKLASNTNHIFRNLDI